MQTKIKIKPIYGWGWFDRQSRIEVPDVFEISIISMSEDEIKGAIITQNHLLTGFELTAWPRHKPNDGYYDCEMLLEPDKKVNGYCQIKL